MGEPATTREEALQQILAFDERQLRNAEQQGAYAEHQLAKHLLSTNRQYYESEVERCAKRAAYFRPQVEAVRWVLEHLFPPTGSKS